MDILPGHLYFVSDAFFAKVSDPYLKIDYLSTKRPHYFAFFDDETGLYWLVPCSSRIDKFKKIIQKKKQQNKPTDTIKIVNIFNEDNALLFQDMFPVDVKYIDGEYSKGNQPVRITDPVLIGKLEQTAKKVKTLLRRGIKFTPTQPDALRIERIMLKEVNGTETK